MDWVNEVPYENCRGMHPTGVLEALVKGQRLRARDSHHALLLGQPRDGLDALALAVGEVREGLERRDLLLGVLVPGGAVLLRQRRVRVLKDVHHLVLLQSVLVAIRDGLQKPRHLLRVRALLGLLLRHLQRLVLGGARARHVVGGLHARVNILRHRLDAHVVLHAPQLKVRVFEGAALHLARVPQLLRVLVGELVGGLELAAAAGDLHHQGLARGLGARRLDLHLRAQGLPRRGGASLALVLLGLLRLQRLPLRAQPRLLEELGCVVHRLLPRVRCGLQQAELKVISITILVIVIVANCDWIVVAFADLRLYAVEIRYGATELDVVQEGLAVDFLV
mmetsp:Transcript_26921/g.51280  ORF Transcript_26921/g.51280 Transcript_26921/m.51280 type:complete len:336 (-) Transcript_26921:551-1558(-)